MKSRVAFTAGGNRSQNIEAALRLIENDINLTSKSDLFIKVNFVNMEIQAAATHVDGVRTLLQFLRERYMTSSPICSAWSKRTRISSWT